MADGGRRADDGGVGGGGGRLALARAALAWERIWPGVWPAATLATAFLALALLDVLPALPGWLHAAVLIAFAAGIAATLVAGLRRFRAPGAADARRRVETDSGLTHRPLQTLADRLPDGADPAQAALWRLHQERARRAVRSLALRAPRPDVARRDPYGLRMAAALLLAVAAAGSWGDWGERVRAALTPSLGGGAVAAAPTLDLWIDPPGYTRLPPILLGSAARPAEAAPARAPADAAAAEPPARVRVPAGSSVLARVTGGGSAPLLHVNDARVPFQAADGGSYAVEAEVTRGFEIAVGQDGRSLGRWEIDVVPDLPPTVALAEEPQRTERGTLRLSWRAADDHGLASVHATIRLAEPDGAADAAPVELRLPVPGLEPKEARHAGFHDLTAHPWAGLPVEMTLAARDGAGQEGRAEPSRFVLPERTFTHPVARALVEARKELTRRGQAAREEVARAVAGLSARPQAYGDDVVVFLSMRAVVARLFLDREADALDTTRRLMWETALRIEEGRLSTVERDLRAAQQALADALDRDASDEEIRRLMEELQRAMDRFMEALAREMQEMMARGEQLPQIPFDPDAQVLDMQDLQEMMDRMRQMAEAGARDAARQMLDQLQRMMENLRLGQMQPPSGEMQQQAEMMREMQRLIQEQQRLMDQTMRQSQQGQRQPGQQGRQQQGQQGQQGQGQQGDQSGQMSAMQEQLRRQLGEIMRRMGEMTGDIPQELGRAERAMRGAGQSLGEGRPGEALPQQSTALDELQQGLQGMAEQMAQQMMGQQQGQGGQQDGQASQRPFSPQGRQDRDPLGRRIPGQGQMDTDQVRIPEEWELQRAREILDELRRRSGETARPQLELEYIERLLRRFGP